MNSTLLPSSLILRLPSRYSPPHHQLQPRCVYGVSSPSLQFPFYSRYWLRARHSSIGSSAPSNNGQVPVMQFEELNEKDWSFLDSDELNSSEEHTHKLDRIISAGGIEETSRVLVSIGSERFVDRLVDTSPCSLRFVVHDSLFLLACIKEKYEEDVRCWQGELIHVPEKWANLDVMFLYFLPALPFKLDQVLGTLEKRCSPGARLVISHPQGREVLEQQKKQYQDVVISDLPNKTTLQKVAADHSFEMVEFVDDPEFYLAVLRFSKARI